MNKIMLRLALLATGLFTHLLHAQITQPNPTLPVDKELMAQQKEAFLKDMQEEKENVVKYEKGQLKLEIEKINGMVEKGTLSASEAQAKKEEAAKKAAQNIDNKTAILDNQIALLERNENYEFKRKRGSYFAMGMGNAYDSNGSTLLGFEYVNNKKPKFDKRTYSDAIFVYGVTNVVSSGSAFKDSPYKWLRSGYYEIGYTLRTRLKKESNFFRLAYGLSFQINKLTPFANKYFVDENGQTTLQTFDYRLKNRSSLSITNLALPVYLEFGPSEKREFPDRFRYSVADRFKAGIGGFIGMNVQNMQYLKYTADGNKHTDRLIQDYNVNNMVYGVGGYVGWGLLSLNIKYDLNPIFKNAEERQHFVSMGLRVDL